MIMCFLNIKNSSENSEELASNEQDSNSGEKDELGTHSHEDLPRTSFVVQVDPKEDLLAAPNAPLPTPVRSRVLRVYKRRPQSLSWDPPPAHDRSSTPPTGQVGSSSAAPGSVSHDSVSGESSDSDSPKSAAATSPTISGQSFPPDDPEDISAAHDSSET
jgi:hypothetical protein